MDADFLLLHRMKHGDDQAIEDFVRKYYPMILLYCQLHIQDFTNLSKLSQLANSEGLIRSNSLIYMDSYLNWPFLYTAGVRHQL